MAFSTPFFHAVTPNKCTLYLSDTPPPETSNPLASHFLTFRACWTKFSITPSNASRSPSFSSVLLVQYSSTSFAVPCIASNFATCSFSSSMVCPASASFVTVQSCRAYTRSRSGAGGGPFLRLDVVGLPCESTEVLLAFPSEALRRDTDPTARESVEFRGDDDERLMDGRMSFFCFEAGRISSRSIGTPRETRKRRRIRERIQFGGCKGGGATSCDQSDALRCVRKVGFSGVMAGRVDVSIVSGAKRASM